MTGCGVLGAVAGPDVPRPYPAGCAAFDLSPRRCEFIVRTLADQAGVDMSEARSIDLLGDPGCDQPGERAAGQPPILCARTVAFVVRVRFGLADGTARERSQFCGVGGQYTLLCSDRPEIAVWLPTGDYFDLPCAAEPPFGCATRFPEPDPETIAASRPIVVPRLDIPIDHVGQYRLDLGTGSLPNGILSSSSMTLADPAPTNVLLEGSIRLEVVPVDPNAPPFDNYYQHGSVDGVQAITAAVTFSVTWFQPGAVISLSGIEVR